MTKAEKTKQYIIEHSATIFNRKGYENTSLADIQEATKLTKGAIYGNFSDKNELAVAAYEFSCDTLLKTINALFQNAQTAKDGILAYCEYYVQNWQYIFTKGGCPFMNAAIEADDNSTYLQKNVRKTMKQFIVALRKIIEQGQANQEFSREVNAEEFAVLIFTIMEGHILLAKTMSNKKYFTMAKNRIADILESELSL